MWRSTTRSLLLASTLTALSACGTTSLSVDGRVVSAGENAPVAGALVRIGQSVPPGGATGVDSVYTDAAGRYALDYGPVRCRLLCPRLFVSVEAEGYRPRYYDRLKAEADSLAVVVLRPAVGRPE